MDNRRKLFLLIILIFINIFLLHKYITSSLRKTNQSDVDLPSAENIVAKKNSIYFHETSSRGQLTVRQACCIESCARTNRKFQTNVIFSSRFESDFGINKLLSQIGNIKFFTVDIANYVKGTPIENFDTSILQKSKWPMHVTSDALRFLTLYKLGGIYLDLDVMVIRPLEFLGRNWAAIEDAIQVGSSAIAFATDTVGRYVAEQAIINFVDEFNLTDYVNNGPGVITRVLNELCETDLPEPGSCLGFKIYPRGTFSPIPYHRAAKYFQAFVISELKSRNIFGYHMFNYVSKNIRIEEHSFYANLAKEYCPTIYNEFSHEFSYHKL
ncbi:lactosylceramide 4-alpha-galactosyltransferase-like [Plodia interpunctella]|uniref:lactosylceramide 4-alpha-galactosyltransferase-like n=1 Tax=Plodia interpunctella TaxID=58824 RepID=UPI002368CED4|nr:lactosylceramide 4-alpha-galactosyltransferase-like [Plodia interpunctella]